MTDYSVQEFIPSLARGRALQNAVSFIRTSTGVHVVPATRSENQVCQAQHGNAMTTPMSSSPPMPVCHESTGSLDIPEIDCICNRKLKTILCRSCGQMFHGRVRRKCLLHPNSIHLMDMVCCPVCKASQIKEFTDTDSERKRNI